MVLYRSFLNEKNKLLVSIFFNHRQVHIILKEGRGTHTLTSTSVFFFFFSFFCSLSSAIIVTCGICTGASWTKWNNLLLSLTSSQRQIAWSKNQTGVEETTLTSTSAFFLFFSFFCFLSSAVIVTWWFCTGASWMKWTISDNHKHLHRCKLHHLKHRERYNRLCSPLPRSFSFSLLLWCSSFPHWYHWWQLKPASSF